MASITGSLAKALPKPKYTGEHEKLSTHAVVGSDSLDLVPKQRTGPPAYGSRAGWRPRSAEDYGDGGAFPEITHMAQYPLGMGSTMSSSNALAVSVDGQGSVKWDAIARRGHNEKRIILASFKDLIPLRDRADSGDISLSRPSAAEIADSTEKTKLALEKLVSGAVASQKPKNIQGLNRNDPTYVRYTPANQKTTNTRIFKIVEKHKDPFEGPKFKHKKIPRGPPSPPPPVMHSPTWKYTSDDQAAWKITHPISNCQHPRG